jgi:hypothetical protein
MPYFTSRNFHAERAELRAQPAGIKDGRFCHGKEPRKALNKLPAFPQGLKPALILRHEGHG